MNFRDLLILLFVPLSWGFGLVAAQIGMEHFPPLLIMGLRFGLAAIILIFLVPIPKHYLLKIFYISIVASTIQYGFTFNGLKIIGSSTASFLIQTEVPFAILVGAIALKEIPSLKEFIGLFVAFFGVVFLLGAPTLEGQITGALLVLMGACTWAIGQVMIKSLNGQVNGFTLICWIAVFSSPQMILISAIIDGNPINYIFSANLVSWLSVLYLATIMTVLGYAAWFYSLAKHSMPVSVPFLLLQPLTAILGSFIIFGEIPGYRVITGGFIIIFGLIIIQFNIKNLKLIKLLIQRIKNV